MLPFGSTYTYTTKVGLEGLRAETPAELTGSLGWTTLLRKGGLECVELQSGFRQSSELPKHIDAAQTESDVLTALEQARRLSNEGLLDTPFVLSLQFHHFRGMVVMPGARRRLGNNTINEDHITIDPIVVNNWEDVHSAARTVFHTMWQAWGYARSPYYDDDGSRRN